MATLEDNSNAVQHITREQKRAEYKFHFSNARLTWQNLRDDLVRIGQQYFDYSADLAFIEENLHDIWDELIYAAKCIPSDSSEHDRILGLIITVQELGPFARKKEDTSSGSNEERAILSNGQQLWTDLPYLAHDFQKFWINESTSLVATERENLAVLTSKLFAAGVCSVELGQCGLWLFKETLEKDNDQDPKDSRIFIHDLLPACVQWLTYGNFRLVKLAAENYNPAVSENEQSLLAPGPLAIKANVTQPGFSVARWLFWRQRLGELYLSGDQKIVKTARKGFDGISLTGMAVGIQIPGEKKYLERLFGALDKALAALNAPGCIRAEDIDINPAWAIEE